MRWVHRGFHQPLDLERELIVCRVWTTRFEAQKRSWLPDRHPDRTPTASAVYAFQQGVSHDCHSSNNRMYPLNRPHPNPSRVPGDGTWGIVACGKIGKLAVSGRKASQSPMPARYREPAQSVRTGREFCPSHGPSPVLAAGWVPRPTLQGPNFTGVISQKAGSGASETGHINESTTTRQLHSSTLRHP